MYNTVQAALLNDRNVGINVTLEPQQLFSSRLIQTLMAADRHSELASLLRLMDTLSCF